MGGDFLGSNISIEPGAPRSTAKVSEEAASFSGVMMVVLSVLMATLVFVTVLGNALVILAFVVDKSLRNQSNYFFLNLAISDFLVGAFCIPVYIPYILTGRWMFGRGLCKLWLVVDYLLCTASVFNIVLISYDRFLSVTRAVTYRAQQGMSKHAISKMVAVWVLAFLLYGPAIIFWEFIIGKSNVPGEECYAEFYYTWYFLLCASTFEFFAPFISVAYFNLSIYLNIRKRNKSRLNSMRDGNSQLPSCQAEDQMGSVFFVKTSRSFQSEALSDVVAEQETSPSSTCQSNTSFIFKKKKKKKKKKRSGTLRCINVHPSATDGRLDTLSQKIAQHSRLSRDKKVAKSLAIIVCIFGICWAPYTLLMIIRAACSGRCVQYHWYEITFWLLWLNSAINPFLYPLCHSSFRRAFAKILCPKRQTIRPQIEPQSCQ
ncbi:histamine H3 receptor [Polypterus senegalus]|uniref:histamine H3 receptor n=1 Tax=Polypterus senegalus TaxID=55291 RepID=UPI00196439D7|nr:histamine H3 receptor [Polypterus senegalus]